MTQVTRIRQLSPHTRKLVAAAEVIESPSTAVKELLDNAIDAGASHIQVILEQGGLSLITVIDNGQGIHPQDIPNLFKRHFTSKIAQIEDLDQLSTLGFRGEALASLAQVGQVTVSSRAADFDAGYRVHSQETSQVKSVGQPLGTKISVKDIFEHIPARKKFFTATSSWRQIRKLLHHYLLFFPQIAFSVTHNQKSIFNLASQPYLLDRTKLIWPESVTSQLKTGRAEFKDWQAEWIVSTPHQPLAHRQWQHVAVNSRPVQLPEWQQKINRLMANKVPRHRYLAWQVALTGPSQQIDHNTHPRKWQVALQNEAEILSWLQHQITQTLQQPYSISSPQPLQLSDSNKPSLKTLTQLHHSLKDAVTSWQPAENDRIWQLQRSFIVIDRTDLVLILDQHAAHERILFYQFSQQFLQGLEFKKITLSSPISLDLEDWQSEILDSIAPDLSLLGMKIENFGHNRWHITELPQIFDSSQAAEILKDVVVDIDAKVPLDQIHQPTYRTLAYLACKAAVKADQVLTKPQMLDIAQQWLQTPDNETCPHGRPISKILTKQQIGSWFGR